MIEDMIGGGTGLYTLKEAAKYARMSPVTMSRWFNGSKAGERVFSVEETKVIGFLDFIQALAARNLRVHYNVSLQKIRDAVNRAKDQYNVAYPFAINHTTYLFDGEIWIKPADAKITQISGKEHGQEGMHTLIEPYLKEIGFDEKTGLASTYRAYHRGENKIVMNPKVRFGEPILSGCGYTPEAIFEAAKTEGSVEAAARIYGLTKEQVDICVEYFDYLEAA